MKNDRRHELKENDLVDSVGTMMDRVRPHVRTFLGIGVLGLLLIASGILISSRTRTTREAAWESFWRLFLKEPQKLLRRFSFDIQIRLPLAGAGSCSETLPCQKEQTPHFQIEKISGAVENSRRTLFASSRRTSSRNACRTSSLWSCKVERIAWGN